MKYCELDVIVDAQIDIGIKSICINEHTYTFNKMEALVNENGDTYLLDGIIYGSRSWIFTDGKQLNRIKGVKKNISDCHKEGRKENFLDYILFPSPSIRYKSITNSIM